MNKLKFMLAASIAIVALTLSCSNNSDKEDQGNPDLGQGVSSPSGNNSDNGDPNSNEPGTSSPGGGNNNSAGSSSPSGPGTGTSSGSGSGNGNSGNSGGNISCENANTKNYTLVSKTANQFTYAEREPYYNCTEGGVLEQSNNPITIVYSISNNTLIWSPEWSMFDDDSLHFKGTSNNLTGTWTRTALDENSACGDRTYKYCSEYDYETCLEEGEPTRDCITHDLSSIDWNSTDSSSFLNIDISTFPCLEWGTYTNCNKYQCLNYQEEGPFYQCKYNYDITKAVITENTVSITRDVYYTNDVDESEEFATGWKERVIDCNTFEIYKGDDIITVKNGLDNSEIIYKGKSCKSPSYDDPSKSQSKAAAACSQAWNTYNEDFWQYYYEILNNEYEKESERAYASYETCLKGLNLPAELMGDDYTQKAVAAKPLAKFKAKAITDKAKTKAIIKAKAKPKFKPLLKKKK